MLTTEVLKANESLSALSDEQLNAIVTLSQNDENAVIGARFGEVYRTFDENIAKASGISRNGDEKTYAYLDRVLVSLKEQNDDASRQVAELAKEKARLEKVIADGTGDAETKKALTQAQKDLASVTSQYNDLKADYDKLGESHRKELLGLRIDAELATAQQGLKIKAGFPQSVTDVILKNAIGNIKSMRPEFIDDGNGGKVLAFKDAQGAILRNPENQLNPFTASDLLRKELKQMGVLDEGVHQTGAGSEPVTTKPTGDTAVDLSGARTKNEASDIIAKQLLSRGLIKGSKEYQDAFNEAWTTNNVAKLPMM